MILVEKAMVQMSTQKYLLRSPAELLRWMTQQITTPQANVEYVAQLIMLLVSARFPKYTSIAACALRSISSLGAANSLQANKT